MNILPTERHKQEPLARHIATPRTVFSGADIARVDYLTIPPAFESPQVAGFEEGGIQALIARAGSADITP